MRLSLPAKFSGARATLTTPLAWTLLAMGLASLDLSLHLFTNWIPFDEGMLAMAGKLVRHGAWPHRDFTDVYSGGLAVLDAAAQWAFGDDLRALRIPFAAAAIGWVGVLAACFRRFVSPPAAAGLALVAFLWGPPIYPAAMPSWYVLFLGTGVVWCLLRWDETGRPGWWGAAGALIGLALFIKINALFLLAAAGCVLLTDDRFRAGLPGHVLMLAGILGATLMVARGWSPAAAVPFVLPLWALAATGIGHLWRTERSLRPDLTPLVRPGAWLAAGVAAIVLPWVAAYTLGGGAHALLEGVLVLPFRRSVYARMFPPGFWLPDLLAAGLLLLLLLRRFRTETAAWIAAALVGLTFFATEGARLGSKWTVLITWRELRVWAVGALLAVALVRWRETGPRGRTMMIAGWVAAWLALVQYPFAATNYVAYVAPLLFLAGCAAAAGRVARPLGAAIPLALAIWTLGVDHGQPLSLLGRRHASPPLTYARLDLPHGGLRVADYEAHGYEAIIRTLDRWGARTVVAGPDAPEIYYLGDRTLLDRELFEFTSPDWSAATFGERIAAHRPDAVVLNLRPFFSKVPPESVLARLPAPPVADTMIGPFLLLRLAPPPATP
ncbi:MAG TPA: glycosyltransferase family 39 protein [Gemmatimonadales bacterium]|nr:glycosyltransferase family 39 protein [Gemmatimonadales bacterium]